MDKKLSFRQYRNKWIARAFEGRIGQAELYTGIATLLFAPFALYWKPWGEVMSWLPSVIFGLAFLLTVLYGMSRAPYWMYLDQESENTELAKVLQAKDKKEGVDAALASLHHDGYELLLNGLQLLSNPVIEPTTYGLWKTSFEGWYGRAQSEIGQYFGQSKLQIFKTFNEITYSSQHFKNYSVTNEHLQDINFFSSRVTAVKNFLEQIDSVSTA